MKSPFLQEMKDRGYLNQCTNLEKLDELSSNKSITAYIGFDCTARSLHVGSLLQIMIFRLLQKYGHKPIVLLGGGTTLIGDPSGKDTTRKVLKHKDINKNIASMYNNVFFKNDTSNAKADLINMNFLTGNINIKMYEESKKIEINKK